MDCVKRAFSLPRGFVFLLLAASAVPPLVAEEDGKHEQANAFRVVLYEGPLVHDKEWKIIKGTVKNDVYFPFGGTCSMVPSDVRNDVQTPRESASEHVIFEAQPEPEGVWNMAWSDGVSGKATAATGQKYRYTYQRRFTYLGATKDGGAPRPNRATPSAGNEGFLQFVPSNVNADALELTDLFLLQEEAGGNLVASSHVRWIVRLRITPTEQPPAFFPAVVDGYIVGAIHDQLAGQLGCDPI